MTNIKNETFFILPEEKENKTIAVERLYEIPDLINVGSVHDRKNSEKGILAYDDSYNRVVWPKWECKNSATLGSSGLNKSTGAVFALTDNAIAQKHSMLIVDPKGENRKYVGRRLEEADYQIVVVDPENPESSDNINCIRAISDYYHNGEEHLAHILIDNLVLVLVPTDNDPRQRSWTDASQKVAAAEILALVKYGRSDASFLALANLHQALFGNNGDIDPEIVELVKRDPEIYGRISHAINNAPNTRGSIVAPIAGAFMAMADTEGKRKVFNSSTIPYDLSKPLAVFVRSENEVSVSSTSIIIEFFRTLIEMTHPGQTFFFNLDESGNYSLPSLPKLMSLMRGYGCYTNIVLQSVAQLESFFDNARTILDNIHVWYVYSCDDPIMMARLIQMSPIGPNGHVVTPDVLAEIPKVKGRVLVLSNDLAGLTWFCPAYERGLIPYTHTGTKGGDVVTGEQFFEKFACNDLDTLLELSKSGESASAEADNKKTSKFKDNIWSSSLFKGYDDYEDEEIPDNLLFENSKYISQVRDYLLKHGISAPTDRTIYLDLCGLSIERGLGGAIDAISELSRCYLEEEEIDYAEWDMDPRKYRDMAVRTILGYTEVARPSLDTRGSVTVGEGVYRLDRKSHTAEALMGIIAADGFIEYEGCKYEVTGISDYARLSADSQGKVQIPFTVNTIGKCAFLNRTDVRSIDLEGVFEIGDFAFSGCTNLPKLLDLQNVCVIGRYSFADTGIRRIYLGEGLEAIPDGAFFGTKHLTHLIIPESVKVIGDMAFKDSGLRSFGLPDKLACIGESAFENIGGDSYTSEDYLKLVFPKTLKYIGSNAFAHIGNLDIAMFGQFEAGCDAFAYNNSIHVEDHTGAPEFVEVLMEGL